LTDGGAAAQAGAACRLALVAAQLVAHPVGDSRHPVAHPVASSRLTLAQK
jgi:hypothetical protein